jgi:trimeric autotransporter adhesin
LTGNSGGNPSTNFLGTTDAQPLLFRVDNLPAGQIHPTNANTALGINALPVNSTGNYNTAIGNGALYSNTTGINNTANGVGALYLNTTGTYNIAIGPFALYRNTGGSFNTANGVNALYNNTSSYNTATGVDALLSNTTGNGNTAYGTEALSSNSTGNINTANGSYSLYLNRTGNYNTAVGYNALYNTTASDGNTALGFNSGNAYDMGYYNTLLGANCDVSFAGQYNCIAIGQGVTCPDNNTARIGNSATWSIGGYANWSNISDGRYKKDVQEDVKGIDFIMKLRPVTYHLDVSGISKKLNQSRGKEMDEGMKQSIAEKEKTVQSGFVAQEVEKAAKEIGYDFSGVDKPRNQNDFYGLRYAEFVVPVVKAMQEQQRIIELLKNQTAELIKRIEVLEKK